MGRTILHLLRHNRQFAIGVFLLALVAGFSCLSLISPYPPNDSFVVPPDVPPSWEFPMGTTSRGQDLFWLLSFAIRNTLLFGIIVAVLSRILALAIGLVAGYSGGLVDRVADVAQRHLHRHPAVPDPGAVLLRHARAHVVGRCWR